MMNNFRKQIDNEAVSSYWIKKYDSGIIQLCINTVEKRALYYKYSDNEYNIATPTHTSDRGYRFVIPELKIPKYYLCTETQNKDQISFYWTPYELISSGKMKDKVKASRDEEI